MLRKPRQEKSSKRGKTTTELDFSELTRAPFDPRVIPAWFRELTVEEQDTLLKVRTMQAEIKRSPRSCIHWVRDKLGKKVCCENTWVKFMAGDVVPEEALREYRRQ